MDSTVTDCTATAGRLSAACPVKGSVTLAEFTRVLAWFVRPPLMRIRPSGPRTTPGNNGRAS